MYAGAIQSAGSFADLALSFLQGVVLPVAKGSVKRAVSWATQPANWPSVVSGVCSAFIWVKDKVSSFLERRREAMPQNAEIVCETPQTDVFDTLLVEKVDAVDVARVYVFLSHLVSLRDQLITRGDVPESRVAMLNKFIDAVSSWFIYDVIGRYKEHS